MGCSQSKAVQAKYTGVPLMTTQTVEQVAIVLTTDVEEPQVQIDLLQSPCRDEPQENSEDAELKSSEILERFLVQMAIVGKSDKHDETSQVGEVKVAMDDNVDSCCMTMAAPHTQIPAVSSSPPEIIVEDVLDVVPNEAAQLAKKASRRRGKKAAKQSEEPVVVVADKENSAAAGRKTAANAAVIAAIIGSAPQSSALKQQAAPLANTNSSPLRADEKPKIRFDRETMQKTAPKSAPAASTNLSRKQKSIIQQGHVSSGRRGPVASKWDKGGKSQMQTEKYLEMANAFERLLTNAATINAHLDTR